MFEGVNVKEFISSLAIVGSGLIALLFLASKTLSSVKPFKEYAEKKKAERDLAKKAIHKIGDVDKGIKDIKTEIQVIKSEVEEVKANQTNQEYVEKGMLELLRFRLNRLLDYILEKGSMTIEESLDLEGQYKAYIGLGGNGRVSTKYELVKVRIDIEPCSLNNEENGR